MTIGSTALGRPGERNRSLVTTVRLRTGYGAWKTVKALVDSGAELNFISQLMIKEAALAASIDGATQARTLNGRLVPIYGTHKIQTRVADSSGSELIAEDLFCAIDLEDYDIVLGYPWLQTRNPDVDWAGSRWRYPKDVEPPGVIGDDEFAQAALEAGRIYAVRYTPLQPVEGEVPGLPQEYAEFADVFSEVDAVKLPPPGGHEHAIELEGGEPPYGPIYNLSERELKVLREYLKDALERGWIRESTSPAGAPILFTPKKDGELRLCVDYRGLNRITRKNRYPLPLISEILDRVVGAKRYTKIDLRHAYHRIRIRGGDEWKTAFRTRYGQFEYQVLPFGLANAPATFQTYINRALRGLVDVTCVVYLDDILIFSKDPAEHHRHVAEVLRRLRQYGLYGKLSKCQFGVETVDFLGYVLSPDGIAMERSRVDTIAEWPEPKSFKEIQIFLGFANFYRRFVTKFSRIAGPLSDLLKGSKDGKKSGPFRLTEPAREAFRVLKEAFTKAPMLLHFDPEKPIRLITDASGFAISGILHQPADGPSGEWHPVAFWSRKMIPAECNYETHDQELLAIVMSLKHWRHYLEGSRYPFVVEADHANLRYFMTTKELSRRQVRWAERLSAFDFEIEYRKGANNPADGPSRRPDYGPTDGDAEAQLLLPTLRNKLRTSSTVGALYTSGGMIPWESDPNCPNWARDMLAECREAAALRLPDDGTSAPRREPESATTVGLGSLKRGPMDRFTGTGVFRHLVPRCLAVKALSTETAYTELQPSFTELLLSLQAKDETTQQWIRQLSDGTPAGPWQLDSQGLLRHEGSVYVPEDPAIRQEVMKANHDDPYAGHFGVTRTTELIKRKYYWPSQARDVREYVRECDVCQHVQTPRHRPYGELQSLPVPTVPWKDISMDMITGLPPSTDGVAKPTDAILVIVDRFTKMAKYFPVRKTLDASQLAQILVTRIVKDFGTPQSIVSDRGSIFTSIFWSSLCYYMKTKRRLSTAYHPQTDGQTERQNQVLEHFLRSYVDYHQDDWVDLLPIAEFAYNNSVHTSTGVTPFYALYGYHPEQTWDVEADVPGGEAPAAHQRAAKLKEVHTRLAKQLKAAVEYQAKYYNKRHTPKEYKVGDWVLLASKNIAMPRPSKKLDHRFLGPFQIEEPIGKQSYRLVLPKAYSRIHPVFHVSLLEPYHCREGEAIPPPPPPIQQSDGEEYEIEQVLDERTRRGKREYLVRWLGYPSWEDSWQPEENLANAQEILTEYQARRDRIGPLTEPKRQSKRKRTQRI
jgi:hypothetical protein